MSSPEEEEVFVLASTYLDDALHCRNISFVPGREETRSYRLYKSRPLTALVYFAVVVICLLALFERPALDRYLALHIDNRQHLMHRARLESWPQV